MKKNYQCYGQENYGLIGRKKGLFVEQKQIDFVMSKLDNFLQGTYVEFDNEFRRK